MRTAEGQNPGPVGRALVPEKLQGLAGRARWAYPWWMATPFSIRYPDHDDLIADVVGNLARKHSYLASLSEREATSFRFRVEAVATQLFLDDIGKYTAYDPDPTGRALYVARYLPDVLERNVARAAEYLVDAAAAA